MIELFKAFLVVLEEGSLNRAATRLHVSQPSLSRQMQTLEQELGGPLLERQPSGVKPTALGQAAAGVMKPVLERYEQGLAELRHQARGQHAELRIGYLGSAAQFYLNPALAELRKRHPELRVRLLDQAPGEQMAALKQGAIDLALIGQEGAPLAKDFYMKKLATLGVCVVLPADHRLAGRRELAPADLKGEVFLGAPEEDMPGRNRWIARICRAGGFKPRFIGDATSIGECFSMIASEGAVTLLPDYFTQSPPPGVVLVPLIDKAAQWELLLLWQRGRAAPPLKAMVEILGTVARQVPGLAPSRRIN